MSEPSSKQIYDAILDIKEDVGEIKAGLANNAAHTSAVSKKMDMHMADPFAHPAAARSSSDGWAKWLALAVSALAFIFSMRGVSGAR